MLHPKRAVVTGDISETVLTEKWARPMYAIPMDLSSIKHPTVHALAASPPTGWKVDQREQK
jgi:hypothetical protein